MWYESASLTLHCIEETEHNNLNTSWLFYSPWNHLIFNLLVPERCCYDFKSVISEHVFRFKYMIASGEIVRGISQNAFDDKVKTMREVVFSKKYQRPIG